MNTEKIVIHESRNSEKVIRSIDLTLEALSAYCSKEYAERIIAKKENGQLWGVYLTNAGKIRATFI